jgi:hypothetical protein
MNNRDAILSAQFPPATSAEPFLELDLRDIYTDVRLGRRGQLQVMTKSCSRLWMTSARISRSSSSGPTCGCRGPDSVPWSLGRAAIPEPVLFGPRSADSFAPAHHDPWVRAVDRLALDLDHRQLDEIERKRRGGPLMFTFLVGGIVYHGGRIAILYPSNHHLTYDVSASDWIRLLAQLGYGTYVTIEVPLTSPNGLTGEVRKAAQAPQEAQAAFLRGDYEDRCRLSARDRSPGACRQGQVQSQAMGPDS